MPEKLFMTDLDGTALGGGFIPYDRLPDHYSDFLDELVLNGWDWAINSTWDPEGQWKLIQRSKVKSRPRFLIAEFGRQLVEVRNNELVRVNPYTEKNDQRISEYCRKYLLPLLNKLCMRIQPRSIMYYEHLVTVKYRHEITRDMLPELADAEASGVFDIYLDKHTLALRAGFLSKGLPMPIIIDEFGYQPESIVCAGDELMDLGMMDPEYSKVYLAPGNAGECLKRHVIAHSGYIGTRNFAAGIIEAFYLWQQNTTNKERGLLC